MIGFCSSSGETMCFVALVEGSGVMKAADVGISFRSDACGSIPPDLGYGHSSNTERRLWLCYDLRWLWWARHLFVHSGNVGASCKNLLFIMK